MAEDKRIRISTDASGVQSLRQNIAQFYADIEGKSHSWRQMAESDIDAIYQKWEKLIQLRLIPMVMLILFLFYSFSYFSL